LLHLDERIQRGQHYCGYASDIDKRLQLHQAGYGAEYTRLAHRRGVGMHLVRVWPDVLKDLQYASRGWLLCDCRHIHMSRLLLPGAALNWQLTCRLS
jgi:hypothetical protein